MTFDEDYQRPATLTERLTVAADPRVVNRFRLGHRQLIHTLRTSQTLLQNGGIWLSGLQRRRTETPLQSSRSTIPSQYIPTAQEHRWLGPGKSSHIRRTWLSERDAVHKNRITQAMRSASNEQGARPNDLATPNYGEQNRPHPVEHGNQVLPKWST
jgi:hypothetical protein